MAGVSHAVDLDAALLSEIQRIAVREMGVPFSMPNTVIVEDWRNIYAYQLANGWVPPIEALTPDQRTQVIEDIAMVMVDR